jgi:hypothetical protein
MRCYFYGGDLDGKCSAAIVKYRFPDCELIAINHEDEFPSAEIKRDDTIFMVDFSLPAEKMYKLAVESNLYWIDHHEAAIRECEAWEAGNSTNIPLSGGCRDVNKAACELTWEYLFPDREIPRAVAMLGRYAVGDLADEKVLPFQMRARLDELDPIKEGVMAKWICVLGQDYAHLPQLLENTIRDGRLLIRFDKQQKAKYARTYAFNTELSVQATPGSGSPNREAFSGIYKAIALNIGHASSKVFDSVYDPAKHDLMIAFCRRPDHKWDLSLYSTKSEVDASIIAKAFGGSGHKGDASTQVETLPFDY